MKAETCDHSEHKIKHILLIVANEGFVLWFDNVRNRMHTPTINTNDMGSTASDIIKMYILNQFVQEFYDFKHVCYIRVRLLRGRHWVRICQSHVSPPILHFFLARYQLLGWVADKDYGNVEYISEYWAAISKRTQLPVYIA
jgi:hypothetical protein